MTGIEHTKTATPFNEWLCVGTLEELIERRIAVVSGGRHGVAVVAQEDSAGTRVFAVDNRCPHMGFPLSKGTACDGILTCHWHHARFDLTTGGTFDPFADDVAVHEVRVVDGVVWVDPHPLPVADRAARDASRLRTGLEQNLSLVIVKSILGLMTDDPIDAPRRVLEVGGTFGARYRAAGWGPGLTILAAMGNIVSLLEKEDRAIALFHGLSHVANDCSNTPTRFQLDPLPTQSIDRERLKSWFRQFIEVRNSDGAERTLLTAIAAGHSPDQIRDLMMSAVTDHFFVNGGHTLDFVNKAFELLENTGWDHASAILPSLVGGMARATRSEEQNAWRAPIDLIALTRPSVDRLSPTLGEARSNGWADFDPLVETLLGDDPAAIVSALDDAWENDATPSEVSLSLSYASALRIARFAISNEFGDWISVLHTFSYCNALHRSLLRAPSREVARGIYHGALKLYLDRFLNVPPAKLPEDTGRGVSADALQGELLDLLDRQAQVGPAAVLIDAYLRCRGPDRSLFAALGRALLREDAEFHSYQLFEAGVSLYQELVSNRPDHARKVAIAMIRYLAAHSPTHREMRQTARIAIRLQRGDDLSESED